MREVKSPTPFQPRWTLSRFCRQEPLGILAFLILITNSAWLPAQAQQSAIAPGAVVSGPGSTPPLDPSASSSSESKSFGERMGGIGRTVGQDEWHFIKAPFKRSALKWDLLMVGATATLVTQDEKVLHQVPASWHPTSHDISNGCIYGTAAMAGGIYFTGLINKSKYAQETGIRTAEATVDSVIMYGVLKVITERQRPYTGAGEGRFFAGNWKNSSFPSGHSMFAWTIASTLAHRYHSVPFDLLLYSVATAESVTRVTAGQHFPSDVLVGSVFGYLIGDYVAQKPESGFPIRGGSRFRRIPYAILKHVSFGGQ